jgi:hypothetical protein
MYIYQCVVEPYFEPKKIKFVAFIEASAKHKLPETHFLPVSLSAIDFGFLNCHSLKQLT